MNDNTFSLGLVCSRRQMLKGMVAGLAAAGLMMVAPPPQRICDFA